ncbi:MAG: flavin reductase family protein [Chloroflexota bacterium]
MAEKRQLDHRMMIRLLQPGPLALVTTLYRSVPNAMTAAWIMPLSMDPARVGVAIRPDRLTHEFVTRSEFFTLNVPNLDLLSAVHRCGVESGRDGDKFERAGLQPADGDVTDVPLIEQCVAHIECGLGGRFEFGDHDLFIGEVLGVQALDEAFDEVWKVDVDAGKIIHHLGGSSYAGLSRPYSASLSEDE